MGSENYAMGNQIVPKPLNGETYMDLLNLIDLIVQKLEDYDSVACDKVYEDLNDLRILIGLIDFAHEED